MSLATIEQTSITNRSAVLETISSEISPATRKAYAQEMKSLNDFFGRNGWNFYPTDEDGVLKESLFLEQVLSYIQMVADAGRSLSTLTKVFSAVKHVTSYENPRAYAVLTMKPAKAFMAGMNRSKRDETPRKAEAFTLDLLTSLYKSIGADTPRDIRDKAIIAFGIATALRSQSLADLTLADVKPAVRMDGYLVRLRHSKTDQEGKGHFIPVAKSDRKRLDPVRALNAWLNVLALYGYNRADTPDAPLFPNVRGLRGVQAEPMRHPSIAITEMIRRRLVEAELSTPAQAEAFSSHSLRATFITLSSQAGVAEKDIAAVSTHVSMATLRSYDRSSVEVHAQTDYLNPKK